MKTELKKLNLSGRLRPVKINPLQVNENVLAFIRNKNFKILSKDADVKSRITPNISTKLTAKMIRFCRT